MNDPSDEAKPDVPMAELFVALTTRWRRTDGSLAFGVSEQDLLRKGELSPDQWEHLQVQLRARVEALGMELVDYSYQEQRWWCCRTLYPVPPELDENEMAVLAAFLYRAAKQADRSVVLRAPLASLRSLLIDGGYLSTYAFDRTLRQLQDKGYLSRSRQTVVAEARLLLEIPEENRDYLVSQVEKLIV